MCFPRATLVQWSFSTPSSLRPGFDPGLVRGPGLVDLNLTPRVFLRDLPFSFLGKNQLSRQNLRRRAY